MSDAPIVPKTSGIYRITCTANGKIYIGSTSNLRRRWNDHCYSLRNNKHRNEHLQRAWNQYGETSFVFEIVELVMPWSRVDREQYWFDKLKPFDHSIGFNIAHHADTPAHTPETREKISKSHMGIVPNAETRARMSADRKGNPSPRKGVKLQPEQLAKMTFFKKGDRINLGRKHSPEHRAKNAAAKSKRWIVTNPDGQEIAIENLAQFCRENGLNKSHMCQVALNRKANHKGWKCQAQ